jgi:hypothetical protein
VTTCDQLSVTITLDSIRDGLKKASYVPKILGKCQTLARFSHKSSKIADLLDQMNKNISKMNVTRWNSEYMLTKSILSIDKKDLDLITSVMDNPVKFSNTDLIILEEIVNILEPFYEISIKCQADLAVTACLVVPSIVHLITVVIFVILKKIFYIVENLFSSFKNQLKPDSLVLSVG